MYPSISLSANNSSYEEWTTGILYFFAKVLAYHGNLINTLDSKVILTSCNVPRSDGLYYNVRKMLNRPHYCNRCNVGSPKETEAKWLHIFFVFHFGSNLFCFCLLYLRYVVRTH